MKIIRNSIIPFGRKYAAVNLCGVIFAKRDVCITRRLLRHEHIHTLQMRELAWVTFYILYVIEWLWRLVQCRGRLHEAYTRISFEREAYSRQDDDGYASRRPRFAQWRRIH